MLLLIYPRKSYRHPALRELAEASVVYHNWQYLIAKIQRSGETTKKKEGKNGLVEKNSEKGNQHIKCSSSSCSN